MDKTYFISLLKDLSPTKMLEFLEYVYEEGQEGVEHNEQHGFSSVLFLTWLGKGDNVNDNIIKRFNEIKEQD